MEFKNPKSKKSLIFTELLCDFRHNDIEYVAKDSFTDESLFIISTLDLWYGDVIVYLQAQNFRLKLSKTDSQRIWYQYKQYNIVNNTLYHSAVDFVFRHCLNFQEDEKNLNEFHSGACGGHMS